MQLRIRELADKYLPLPGSNRGFKPSVFVNSIVLMLQGGGRSFEDLRELKTDNGLMKLIGYDNIPDPDTAGDWMRRMGDIKNEQLGLKGLGKVRDVINHRIMKRDKTEEYTLDADATEIVAEKDDAMWTIATFRWKPVLGSFYRGIIQVAGRIVKYAGSIILKIAAGIERLELFIGIRR